MGIIFISIQSKSELSSTGGDAAEAAATKTNNKTNHLCEIVNEIRGLTNNKIIIRLQLHSAQQVKPNQRQSQAKPLSSDAAQVKLKLYIFLFVLFLIFSLIFFTFNLIFFQNI